MWACLALPARGNPNTLPCVVAFAELWTVAVDHALTYSVRPALGKGSAGRQFLGHARGCPVSFGCFGPVFFVGVFHF